MWQFNTKGCPEDLIFGGFNNQPIPPPYSDFKNDYDDYGTPIDASLEDSEGVEDVVVKNYEYTNGKISTDNDDILASDVDPLQNEIIDIEGVDLVDNETEES